MTDPHAKVSREFNCNLLVEGVALPGKILSNKVITQQEYHVYWTLVI